MKKILRPSTLILLLASALAGTTLAQSEIIYRGTSHVIATPPSSGGGDDGGGQPVIPPVVTPPAPAPAAFHALSQRPIVSGTTGNVLSIGIGTYSGPTSGWSCDTPANVPWLGCTFASGEARAVGTPTTAQLGEVTIPVRNGAFSQNVVVDVNVVAPAVFTAASPKPSISTTSGSIVDIQIGTYSGGRSWSCEAVSGANWLSCAFENGVVRLRGQAGPARTGDVTIRLASGVDGFETSIAVTVTPVVSSFTARSNVPISYAPVGRTTSILVGAYQDNSPGWTCGATSGTLPAWISCSFEDGKVWLDATPVSVGYAYQQVAVLKDGVSKGNSQNVLLYRGNQDYASAPAPKSTPRTGTVTIPSRIDRYATTGKSLDFIVGTYPSAQGDEGWVCSGQGYILPDWLSCSFQNGNVHLRGTAPASRTNRVGDIIIARDSVSVGTVPIFILYVDNKDYPNADATPLTPRSGSFVSRSSYPHLYAPNGTAIDTPVGTYAGDASGWMCAGVNFQMPSWLYCAAENGVISLRGTAPASGMGSNLNIHLMFIKDGQVRSTINNSFEFHHSSRGYSKNDATPASPRPATWTPANPAVLESAIGAPVEILLGSYAGGDEGWACGFWLGSVPAWATCHFESGKAYLRGTPPSGVNTSYPVIVRDGVIFQKMNSVTAWAK